jgi:hypothetical protein
MAKCPEQDCSESDGELGMSVSLTSPLMNCLPMAIILALTKRGVMSMPRKLPPHVERNHVKATHTYHFVAAKDLAFVCLKIPRAKSLWRPTKPRCWASQLRFATGLCRPRQVRSLRSLPPI